MGGCYLCSRSELFRDLYIDTGTRPLFVSPPPGFIEWFSRVIPPDYMEVEGPDSIPEDEVFDLIMIWINRHGSITEEHARSLKNSYSGKRGIWIGLETGSDPVTGSDHMGSLGLHIRDPPITLSTEYDLYRAWTDLDK